MWSWLPPKSNAFFSAHVPPFHRTLQKSVDFFLRDPANKQTNKQNRTSSALVTTAVWQQQQRQQLLQQHWSLQSYDDGNDVHLCFSHCESSQRKRQHSSQYVLYSLRLQAESRSTVRAGLRHRPTIGHGLGPRGFRGPALSKVKEMCRHICLTKRAKKCFGLLHGLSRTVSGINGDFRRKSPFFPPPCIYSPRWNWVSA